MAHVTDKLFCKLINVHIFISHNPHLRQGIKNAPCSQLQNACVGIIKPP
nr:MAG TPA: hypothetical protein [Caudoviricetes sp.]DAQ78863.1 MAG TPA: hypothetical protein [Caudoviricetes sp.]